MDVSFMRASTRLHVPCASAAAPPAPGEPLPPRRLRSTHERGTHRHAAVLSLWLPRHACRARADDLGLEDGWGVEPVQPVGQGSAAGVQPAGGKPATKQTAKQAAKQAAKPTAVKQTAKQGAKPAADAQPAAGASGSARGGAADRRQQRRRTRSPFVDMTSTEGSLSLSLLQQQLMRAEAGETSMTADDQRQLLESLPAAGKQRRRLSPAAAAAVAPTQRPRQRVVYEDDDGNVWEELEDEDVTDKSPSFELNLVDQDMEYVEYDKAVSDF
eukprot:357217-Chlamydomonas_euryale.AAC.5